MSLDRRCFVEAIWDHKMQGNNLKYIQEGMVDHFLEIHRIKSQSQMNPSNEHSRQYCLREVSYAIYQEELILLRKRELEKLLHTYPLQLKNLRECVSKLKNILGLQGLSKQRNILKALQLSDQSLQFQDKLFGWIIKITISQYE